MFAAVLYGEDLFTAAGSPAKTVIRLFPFRNERKKQQAFIDLRKVQYMETVWLIVIIGLSCGYLIWRSISAVRQQKSCGGSCRICSCTGDDDTRRC